MFEVSSHSPHLSRALGKCQVYECRDARGQDGRWSRWGKCQDPFLEPQRVSRIKSLGFQEEKNNKKLSPEIFSSASYTDRLITALITQVAPFERKKPEPTCYPPSSLLLSAWVGFLVGLLKCNHSSVWRLVIRSMIEESWFLKMIYSQLVAYRFKDGQMILSWFLRYTIKFLIVNLYTGNRVCYLPFSETSIMLSEIS